MKTFVLTLLMSIFAWTMQAQNDSDLFTGKWSINAPSAPYGYQDGELVFQQMNGQLTVDVDLSGTVLKIRQLKKENYGYSCSEYIDGSQVYIKFIISNKNGKKTLSGEAEADGQVIDVQLTRKK